MTGMNRQGVAVMAMLCYFAIVEKHVIFSVITSSSCCFTLKCSSLFRCKCFYVRIIAELVLKKL